MELENSKTKSLISHIISIKINKVDNFNWNKKYFFCNGVAKTVKRSMDFIHYRTLNLDINNT